MEVVTYKIQKRTNVLRLLPKKKIGWYPINGAPTPPGTQPTFNHTSNNPFWII